MTPYYPTVQTVTTVRLQTKTGALGTTLLPHNLFQSSARIPRSILVPDRELDEEKRKGPSDLRIRYPLCG